MNACLPLTLAKALAPMAAPSSIVHQILSDDRCQALDAVMLRIKQDPQRLQKLADKLTHQEMMLSLMLGSSI